jgi:hypothetical protein
MDKSRKKPINLLTHVTLSMTCDGSIHLDLLSLTDELHRVQLEVEAHHLAEATMLMADRGLRQRLPFIVLELKTDLLLGVAYVKSEVGQLENLKM